MSDQKKELFEMNIDRPDEAVFRKVKETWDGISKPIDGLGDFETLICRIAAIQGNPAPSINKRAAVKLISAKTNGLISFKYENPNGVYSLPFINSPEYNVNTILYTDGDCSNNMIYKESGNSAITRSIKIDNSTFTIMLNNINNCINKGEVRGTFHGDYLILYEEISRLLQNIDESYNEIISESPKVYKYKRH